jgi:FKBP-type peptidyl-prolyl cis-trans isomerase
VVNNKPIRNYNKITITMGKSTEYYRTHPEAREKKAETDKKINARPEQKRKRAQLAKANREHDKRYGKESRAGKDLCHTKHGLRYKPASVNRGNKSDTPGDRKARGNKL